MNSLEKKSATANKLLTVAQSSRESGVPKHTLYNAIHKGSLPVIRVGPFRRPRIQRAALDRYLA
jgi:excisionase family DNA binding protein